jgi:hypothetical protein
MDLREISVKLDGGGSGAKIAISGASAQSAALSLKSFPTPGGADARDNVLVYVTVDCFVRNGTSPTAVVDTDVLLPGPGLYRLSGIKDGEKLAFITSGAAGNAWVYPGA